MKFFKKSDFILIAGLVLLASGLWLGIKLYQPDKAPLAEIYQGRRLVKTIPLSQGREEIFHLEGIDQVTFRLNADGSIQFLKSDCPDQICVQTGRISKVGESAACLPNKLLIKIVPDPSSKEDRDTDIIVR